MQKAALQKAIFGALVFTALAGCRAQSVAASASPIGVWVADRDQQFSALHRALERKGERLGPWGPLEMAELLVSVAVTHVRILPNGRFIEQQPSMILVEGPPGGKTAVRREPRLGKWTQTGRAVCLFYDAPGSMDDLPLMRSAYLRGDTLCWISELGATYSLTRGPSTSLLLRGYRVR